MILHNGWYSQYSVTLPDNTEMSLESIKYKPKIWTHLLMQCFI